MIDVSQGDIGKTVVYRPPMIERHRYGGFKSANDYVEEVGVITSFNDSFVFVRFMGDDHSKATRRNDLSWKEKGR